MLRSTSVAGMLEYAASLPANTTSYRDTDLGSGKQYWYIVSVMYGENSPFDYFNYSNYANATTLSQ